MQWILVILDSAGCSTAVPALQLCAAQLHPQPLRGHLEGSQEPEGYYSIILSCVVVYVGRRIHNQSGPLIRIDFFIFV